jgi:hypothetical protein
MKDFVKEVREYERAENKEADKVSDDKKQPENKKYDIFDRFKKKSASQK